MVCQNVATLSVGIIMGSDSDLSVMKDATRILNMYGVPNDVNFLILYNFTF